LQLGVTGESYDDRNKRIADGIRSHYLNVRDGILDYKQQGLPVIATGHLFAAGSKTSDSEKDIHIGSIGQIGAEIFPSEFDYIALGHLHRPQTVDKQSRIRYSGSPIPLSFSEIADKKQVLLVEIHAGMEPIIEPIEIPQLRQLICFKGDFGTVKSRVVDFEVSNGQLPAWVEIIIELEGYNPDIDRQIREVAVANPSLEIVKVRSDYSNEFLQLAEQFQILPELDDLKPTDVFLKKLESVGREDSELIETFQQLLSRYNQQEIN